MVYIAFEYKSEVIGVCMIFVLIPDLSSIIHHHVRSIRLMLQYELHFCFCFCFLFLKVPNTIEFADWIGRTKQKKIRVTG